MAHCPVRPDPVEGRATSAALRGTCFDKLSTNGKREFVLSGLGAGRRSRMRAPKWAYPISRSYTLM